MKFDRRLRRWTVLAAGLGAGVALMLAVSGEIPAWREGGTRIATRSILPPRGTETLHMGAAERVVILGDSNTKGVGLRPGERPFADIFRSRLVGRIEVVARGFGGDTILDLIARPDPVREGDVVMLMYGTNDAAPRGLLSRRSAIGAERFRSTLADLARSYRARGAQVLILAAPPAGSRALERRISPYRGAARNAAADADVAFLDPAEAFAGVGEGKALLNYDAIHLNAHAHALLGNWLGERFVAFSD